MTSIQKVKDSPLVTIILFTYNQEEYIVDAVKSILGQDYTPAQILISDDCSVDKTYQLAKSVIDSYSGPNSVTLNRNEKNLGIGRHVNKLMEMAQGELIFASAGDDFSMPSRVTDTVNYWLEKDCEPLSMCTQTLTIDQRGEPIGKLPPIKPVELSQVMRLGGRWIYGASHAWHRSLFDKFGPLKEDVVSEDKAIGFRSLLLGQDIHYIEIPLVKYRFHSASVTTGSSDRKKLEQKISSINSYLYDFEKSHRSGLLPDELDGDEILKELIFVRDDFTLRHQILTSKWSTSIWTLLTSKRILTLKQKKRLLLRRMKGTLT